MKKLISKIKCRFGFHCWGEVDKKPIRLIGPDILFFTFGEQDGERKCNLCGLVQNVRRHGLVGAGDPSPWKEVK